MLAMTWVSSMAAAVAVVAVLLVTSPPSSAAPQNPVASLGNGNINNLLGDRKLVMATIKCLKGEAPCSRLGNSVKAAIPEVLQNKCARCNRTQKMNANKLINYVMANHPQDYQAIFARYSRG